MQRKQPAPSSFLSDHRPTGRELPGPDRGRAREPTGRGPRQVSQRALRTPSSALRPLPSRAAGGTQAAAGPHLGWAGAYPRALGQGFDPLRQVPTPAPHAGHWQAAACTPVPGSQRGGRGGSEDRPTARGRSNGRCKQAGSTAPVFRVGPMQHPGGERERPTRTCTRRPRKGRFQGPKPRSSSAPHPCPVPQFGGHDSGPTVTRNLNSEIPGAPATEPVLTRGGGAPGAGAESGAPPPRKPKASPKPGAGSSPPRPS
eukprot:XP_005626289.1 uncharacterized protein LOC102151375 [Canis lupus familiaris]